MSAVIHGHGAPAALPADWDVPPFVSPLWLGRQRRWCVVVPVINEGARLHKLLRAMKTLGVPAAADVIIADGGSDDGSLDAAVLTEWAVRGVLVKGGPGGLSAQLRCAYAFALVQGYEGVVTIDGNGKDDPEAIFSFLEALERGVDFVQGSRFVAGGRAVNTPWVRTLAIRGIHVPLLRWASNFPWTDTTQGFRAYSRGLLLDPAIRPFRAAFADYELLPYLSARAPKVGRRCLELPTARRYPRGAVPTKIARVSGHWAVMRALLGACLGAYSPPAVKRPQPSGPGPAASRAGDVGSATARPSARSRRGR